MRNPVVPTGHLRPEGIYRYALPAFFLAIIGGVLPVAIVLTPLSTEILLIVAIAGVTCAPLVIRGWQRQLDVLEPLVIVDLLYILYFVIRPVSDLAGGNMVHRGYDLGRAFDATLALALCGAVALQFAYHVLPASRQARDASPALDQRFFVPYALTLSLLGVVLYGLFVLQIGGFGQLAGIIAGHTVEQDQFYRDTTGYLYQGLYLEIPAALILVRAYYGQRRRRLLLLAALPIGLLLVVSGPNGARASLWLLFGGLVVTRYLMLKRRPRLRTLLVWAIVGVFALSYGTETRTQGTYSNSHRLAAFVALVSDPLGVAQRFVTGPDLEMFDAMDSELQVLPSSLPFRPGSTIAEIPLRAVPRAVWPSKPSETNDVLTAFLYPIQAQASRAAPAVSILGSFYADSGVLGIVIGMSVLGGFLRFLWVRMVRSREDSWSLVTYAATLPLLMLLVRGTIVSTLAFALFVVGPLLLLPRLLPRQHGHVATPVSAPLSNPLPPFPD